jgi:large subunit ribosomal protein L30
MATAKKVNKTLKITQIYSGKGTGVAMQQTLRGLGLRGVNKTSMVHDDACIRGMIFKVKHLIKVEG